MFCEKCGAKLPDGGKFCQECGAQAREIHQGSAPPSTSQPPPASPAAQQVRQVSQDTMPMPPVQPPPVGPGQQGAWRPAMEQRGGNKPPGLNLGLILGITAAIIILVGGGFAAYRFGLMDKLKGDSAVAVEPAPVNNAETVAKPEAAPAEQAVYDPIRVNIASGIGKVETQVADSRVDKTLKHIQGEWYDNEGHKLVTVDGRYINGCEIVAIYDLAGGGGQAAATLRLREKGQEWDMRISWIISNTASDSITVNGSQTLHRKVEYKGESVAGICLGMTPAQVEQKLGKPSRVLDKNNPVAAGSEKFVNGWYYADKGLIVTFGGGSADEIVLLKQSRLRFEKSGLNCSNSPEEFGRAYSMKKMPKWPDRDYNGPNPIENGEFIFFGKDMEYVMLTIYST